MKDSALQLTLRELRGVFTSPRAWAGMGLVILILGFSGPFQTFQVLSLGPRMVYWAIMGITTFAIGSFFGTWAAHALDDKPLPGPVRFLAISIAAGLPVALIVILINAAAFETATGTPLEIFILGLYSIGIAMGISGMFAVFSPYGSSDSKEGEKPAILDRLPVEKRGDLVSLSVQDHYVEVVTARARHLVLMRLSDAMRESGEKTGFQIHRSHWVARKAIASVKKNNGKVSIVTSGGDELPVSRSHVSKLKREGLLS